MNITIDNENYDTNNVGFITNEPDFVRYLKGKYSENFKRFESRFLDPLISELRKNGLNNNISMVEMLKDYWHMVEPYTYEDAFNIQEDSFRALVFSSIDIRKMIDELGAERVDVEGIELNNKTYNELTESFNNEDYSYISELYSVNGEKIGLQNNILYVVKVWCTSINEEHWLWVDETNFDVKSPLDAIASTCVVYKSMIGKIKHIIRQGDVFLFEMIEKVNIDPKEETQRLSSDEYFSLLKSQA